MYYIYIFSKQTNNETEFERRNWKTWQNYMLSIRNSFQIIDFRGKKYFTERVGHYIMINRSFHEKNLAILCMQQATEPKYK